MSKNNAPYSEDYIHEKMLRVALYIRVSTEEQARRGYSLEAQRETLTEYAKAHEMFIVDYYVDEGASARKRYNKRKEFMRMMDDVQADKIDLILFIKLDRWFRSVKDYYKIQEILEAHNVGWACTEEHYDTTTTNGRLHLNIRLSVAQDESDRDSDRIKFVFESKVARGEVISGSVPLGFKIKDKHLVANEETVEIARDIFSFYDLHNNKTGARRYIYEKYGLSISDTTMRKMLSNPLYKGEFRGVSGYCEAIIEPALFDRVQAAAKSSNVRETPAKRIYIFSSLLVCAECGHKMVGRYSCSGPNEYYKYRCNHSVVIKECTHNKTIGEKDIETYLLENIEAEINAYIVDYEVRVAQAPKPRIDKAKIKRKLEKLKELYVNDLITMEEYKTDYDVYVKQLAEVPEPPAPPADFKALKDFIHSDFKKLYVTLDREKRRILWRSVIKSITVDAQNHLVLSFA